MDHSSTRQRWERPPCRLNQFSAFLGIAVGLLLFPSFVLADVGVDKSGWLIVGNVTLQGRAPNASGLGDRRLVCLGLQKNIIPALASFVVSVTTMFCDSSAPAEQMWAYHPGTHSFSGAEPTTGLAYCLDTSLSGGQKPTYIAVANNCTSGSGQRWSLSGGKLSPRLVINGSRYYMQANGPIGDNLYITSDLRSASTDFTYAPLAVNTGTTEELRTLPDLGEDPTGLLAVSSQDTSLDQICAEVAVGTNASWHSGANVTSAVCSSSTKQTWLYQNGTGQLIVSGPEGLWLCLQSSSGAPQEGDFLSVGACTTRDNQKWVVNGSLVYSRNASANGLQLYLASRGPLGSTLTLTSMSNTSTAFAFLRQRPQSGTLVPIFIGEPPPEAVQGSSRPGLDAGAIVGIVLGAVAFAAFVFAACYCWKCVRVRKKHADESVKSDTRVSAVLSSSASSAARSSSGNVKGAKKPWGSSEPVYVVIDGVNKVSFADLAKATGDFARENELGRGGFGVVYKAELPRLGTVAIKRLNDETDQGNQQLMTEVRTLARLNHSCLVKLLGYCDDNNEKVLIYEYLGGGNLASYLYGGRSRSLTWEDRMAIALSVAKGLEYLHTAAASTPIVHRDIKPSNILLDENLNAKLSDFGLSRLLPSLASSHVSTKVQGTPGYIDPDFYVTLHLTPLSDVYSFGVVLLELFASRAAIDMSYPPAEVSLVYWARERQEQGSTVVDPRIETEENRAALSRIFTLAIECVDRDARKRPSIVRVVRLLEELSPRKHIERTRTSEPTDATMLVFAEQMQVPNPHCQGVRLGPSAGA